MSPSLIHLERRPADGRAEGALVLLHGRGTDERDLFGLFDVLDPDQRLRGITVGGPLSLPPGGRHWYVVRRVGFPDPVSFGASYRALARLLDEDLGLDWSTTVVGGFSQGAVMAYALGLGPGRPAPAGILALSGFVPTVEGWESDLASRPGLPVLIAHGSRDPIIGPEFGRAAADRLRDAGLAVEQHETPVGHALDPNVMPDIVRWLAQRP